MLDIQGERWIFRRAFFELYLGSSIHRNPRLFLPALRAMSITLRITGLALPGAVPMKCWRAPFTLAKSFLSFKRYWEHGGSEVYCGIYGSKRLSGLMCSRTFCYKTWVRQGGPLTFRTVDTTVQALIRSRG